MGNDCGRDGMARLGPAVRAEKHRFDATQVIQNNVEKESKPTSLIFEPDISRARLDDLLTTITGSLKVFENAPFIGPAVKIVAYAEGQIQPSPWTEDRATRPQDLCKKYRPTSHSTFKRQMKHYNMLLDHGFQRFQVHNIIGETVEIHYTMDMMHAQLSTMSLALSDYEGVEEPDSLPASYSPLLRDDSPPLKDSLPLRDDSPPLGDDSPLLRDYSPPLRDDSSPFRINSPPLSDDSPPLSDDSDY
ncbi:hypothetical protein DFH08DRAFT_801389 [Mycena albidolilacea]|uniref:Uncharacterized protein n=1 Tax=Mycena albidolilacea TaxID=1033008 RepID=A0AAD7F086_9AGAR|nr:hypothetical protein DFH08DRAFT_801389 [Mycena albidolilacea]